MSRVIVVSNRIPELRKGRASAGGLVVALSAGVKENALWIGWSGKTVKSTPAPPRLLSNSSIQVAAIDLTEADYAGYYKGFANSALWPLLHNRPGLLRFERAEYQAYLKVNSQFADAVLTMAKPQDMIWVQDYHLLPLAFDLRKRGWRGRVGIFIHTPFPPLQIVELLPCHEDMVEMLRAYDAIGVQTPADKLHVKAVLESKVIQTAQTRMPAVICTPAGIDVEEFQADAGHSARGAAAQRMLASLGSRALMLGAERMDYSKGLPERIEAFGRLLAAQPQHIRNVSFLQVASRTREDIPEYRTLKHDIDRLVGEINGRLGDFDWTPVRYVARALPRRDLAILLRMARAGIVTPLRDGMNLVAKEYVAAQTADNPGVLVLSAFAGAAAALTGALIVNPYDKDAIADAMHKALTMPLDERIARQRTNLHAVKRDSAYVFAQRFLGALRLSSAKDAA